LRDAIAFVYRRNVSSKSRAANTPSSAELAALFSALQVELVTLKSHVAERDTQIASLRETVLNLTHENQLLKRRIYGNKTERTRTSELQLALGDLLNDQKLLQKQLDEAVAEASAADDNPGQGEAERSSRSFGQYAASVLARDLRRGDGEELQAHRLRREPAADVSAWGLLRTGQTHREV
jgi:hypothetical protein